MSFLRKLILHYMLLFSFFCIDIWFFFGAGEQVSFFTLAFLITILFSRPLSFPFILTTLLLLMSISFTMGHPLWMPLIYSLPFISIIVLVKPHLYSLHLYPPMVTGLVISSNLLLRPYFNLMLPTSSYTIGIIFVNMFMSSLFSLTLKTGKKGQSLTRSAM